MARKRKADMEKPTADMRDARLATLSQAAAIAGVPGPGRWLLCEYEPTALFSLKTSLATSSVGKTLVVPTPYSIKMAFVDAAFRAGFPDHECAQFFRALVEIEVRIRPAAAACVTHTFVKIRQEPKTPDPLRPYIDSIAYREVVHCRGTWIWAFDLAAGDDALAERLVRLAPHVAYIGKRGSFVQFVGCTRTPTLGPDFTQPVQHEQPWPLPARAHMAIVDDFGPEADLDVLSSYTKRSPKKDRHRRFVETLIPLGLVNTGPGFSEYRAR